MVDNVEIMVRGGRGGDGLISFRHEKYVPRGGPDGGDGGDAGNVILIADSGLVDLSWFKNKRQFKAQDGCVGGSGRRHGGKGKDLVIRLPLGTAALARDKAGHERHLVEMESRATVACLQDLEHMSHKSESGNVGCGAHPCFEHDFARPLVQ